jgi:AcrR family transcriptional regulator
VSDQRPYATLLAKGEERRARILGAAQRLLARNGWRGTTLGQIAKAAGVSSAGLLHHFESKEQLLHAVLDARDAADQEVADPDGDPVSQLGQVAEKYRRSPELIGTLTLLLVENLDPSAPLHDRLLGRYQDAVRIVSDGIRRGQRAGRYRSDLDAGVLAVEIVAFFNGMESSWLLDPSIPVDDVFREYARSVAERLARPAGPT